MLMKIFFLIIFYLFSSYALKAADSLHISSPDNSIRVTINTKKNFTYSISVDNKTILEPSVIDIELINGKKLSNDLSVQLTKLHSANEVIVSPVPDLRKNIPDVYNELLIQFKQNFSVAFRVYNDGVAYRIISRFKDSITIKKETAIFQFAKDAHVFAPLVQKREGLDIYHTSFEELYQYKSLDSLTYKDVMFSPALVSSADNIKIAVTESDLLDYPGMFLKGTDALALKGEFAAYPLKEKIAEGDYPQVVVTDRADYIARTNGARNFPWRVLIIARNDKDLPANDLVYRLSTPSKIKDVSWIHPGKCTDEWIIDVNLFNVPFKSGVNTASYKYYIDFAKRFGFNRIMMDAGWSDTRDLFKISPNINMDTIVAYAKERDIKLSMWTLSMALDKQLDSALKQFQKWGVDFIMTDFIDRDDQKTVNFYKRITEACADAHIMIMFHGAYPPKGFNRTYPNNITRESVLGSEYNAWSDKPTPEHDVTLPFTRMLAGPMDYEPGILDNATKIQFKPIWGKVMSQGTRCHQLAMFVVYNNPLQIFSGNPSQGYLEPKFMELLGGIPTTWDTTIILEAKVADYIITARRKGEEWFIGGMTDWTARGFNLQFNFLSEGNYEATICEDGINADRYAADYSIRTFSIKKEDSIPVQMAPGGGFLIHLKKK